MVIEEKPWQPLGKRHDWTERQTNLYFELTIKDETGTKLDNLKWNTKDGYKRILEIIRLKFGMDYR